MYNSERIETYHEFAPGETLRFEVIPGGFTETPATSDQRVQLFERRLREMQQTLTDGTYAVEPLALPLPGQSPWVLYRLDGEKKQKIGFDGKTYAFRDMDVGPEGVVIRLVEIFYSHVIACRDPSYAVLRAAEGLPSVAAGVGICCALESSDGNILLTERSAAAVAHASFLHTMGGNVDIHATAAETILTEIQEEIGLRPGVDFDPGKLRLMAIATDRNFEDGGCSRPDVVFYQPLRISWNEVEAIFAQKHDREADCGAILPLSLDANFPQHFDALVRENRIIPSGEASLAYAWQLHQERAETAYGL